MTPPRRRPPFAKTAAALSFVVGVALLPSRSWGAFAVSGTFLLLAALAGRIPLAKTTRRVLLLEPFVLGTAALSLFQPGGVPVFVSMLVKSTLCLSGMVLLTETTRFSELLDVARRARIPGPLRTTLTLAYRFLFVLKDETIRMNRARAARRFTRSRRAVWRASATVAAVLFIRSSERAERVYSAMCARGWKS